MYVIAFICVDEMQTSIRRNQDMFVICVLDPRTHTHSPECGEWMN